MAAVAASRGYARRVERELADRGRVIVLTSWLGNVVFALTTIPVAVGVDAFDAPAAAVALALFFTSLVVWVWALVVAAARTTRGDDVAVTTLFLLEGNVPRRVRWNLYGSFGVCLAIAVGTVVANPFAVLVPMFPLGLVGLWGARHGRYPARKAPTARSR